MVCQEKTALRVDALELPLGNPELEEWGTNGKEGGTLCLKLRFGSSRW